MKTRTLLICGISLATVVLVAMHAVRGDDPPVVAAPSPEADSDEDGFTDAQELSWNTDPYQATSFPDVTTGVVGWWPLDEGQGATVADVSGNQLAGQLQGVRLPTWVEEDGGPALAFDGIQNAVAIPDAPTLRLTNGFTALLWVKLQPGSEGAVLGKWTMDRQASAFRLTIEKGRAVIHVGLSGKDYPLYGRRALADGNWHHVACAYDGLELRLCVDGENEVTTHLSGWLPATDGPLLIGQVHGTYCEVGLYGRALADAEVKLLYQLSGESTPEHASLRPRTATVLFARNRSRDTLPDTRAQLVPQGGRP